MAQKKTFLITGASSGLGLCLALCALRCGHRVIGTARNPSVAASNHPDFEKLGGQWLKLDVSTAACQQLVEEAMTSQQTRHSQNSNEPMEWIIINNAGYALQGTIEDNTESQLEHHLQTVMYGTIRVLKAAIPFLRKNKCGMIITMSSILGFAPMAECQIYSATKFAVEAITESYASLLAPLGIKCVILEPGTFRTGLAVASVGPKVEDVPEEYRERYGRWAGFIEAAANAPVVKGDPDKYAARILEIIESRGLGEGVLEKGTEGGKVLRVLGGPDAWAMAGVRLKELNENYATMEGIALSTDFDEEKT